jgi:Holliday junction resolvasome RuvABC endonuclease subunit
MTTDSLSSHERKVVGLDLGTNTGYAWCTDDIPRIQFSGVQSFAPKRHEGGGMRFMRFSVWLEEFLAGDHVIVFYEEVIGAHKSTAAAHIYGGLLALLQQYCERREIPYLGLPVGTVKKFATGRGNASKNDMMAHAEVKFGGSVKSHDQADALWILSLGLRELGVK